jgi:hypothetical protein
VLVAQAHLGPGVALLGRPAVPLHRALVVAGQAFVAHLAQDAQMVLGRGVAALGGQMEQAIGLGLLALGLGYRRGLGARARLALLGAHQAQGQVKAGHRIPGLGPLHEVGQVPRQIRLQARRSLGQNPSGQAESGG